MVSLLFPVYNEEENIEELYQDIFSVIKDFRGHEFEFVFIDDERNE